MKKVIAFMLCLLMLTGVLTACSSSEPAGTSGESSVVSASEGTSSEDSSGETTENIDISGQKVIVCTEAGEAADGASAQINAFKEKFNCDVELVAIPADVYKTKIQTDLAAQSGSYDVIIATMDFTLQFKDSGLLENLLDYASNPSLADPDYNVDDFIPATIASYYNEDKSSLIAYPYKADCQIIFYRKDLMEDPEEQAAFKEKYGYDLAPATSWQMYFDIAEFFTRPDEDFYGTALMMKRGCDQTTCNFFTRLLGTGQGMFEEIDGLYKPIINNENGVKVLQSFRDELVNYAVTGSDNYEYYEANLAFTDGRCMQVITWPGAWANAQNEEVSSVAGKIGAIACPGWEEGDKGGAMMGGWTIVLPSDAKNKEAAYKFIEFASSAEGEALKVSSGCFPSRQSVLHSEDSLYPDFFPIMADALANSTPAPAWAEWGELKTILDEAVSSAGTGVLEPKEALDGVVQEWNDILSDAGLLYEE